jgi:hypothetical protein
MFPPMTPHSERKRYESELEVLEREAIWHAHFKSDGDGLFRRLVKFWSRFNRKPQSAPDTRRVTATQEIQAASGC